MENTSDEQIYFEYMSRLNKELEEEKLKISKLYEEHKNDDGNLLLIIKDRISENSELFVSKYTWTGCSQLAHNDKLFIKSALETSKLCDEVTHHLNQLIQD